MCRLVWVFSLGVCWFVVWLVIVRWFMGLLGGFCFGIGCWLWGLAVWVLGCLIVAFGTACWVLLLISAVGLC